MGNGTMIDKMGSMKFDIDKFTCKNDFDVWRIKMRAILVQQGLVHVLQGKDEWATTLTENERAISRTRSKVRSFSALGIKSFEKSQEKRQ